MPKLPPYLTLLFFILLVSSVAFFGAQFHPGDWYAHLHKPAWTPANWVFPVAWSVLYLMIAIAGWLIFSTSNATTKRLWLIQLALNGLWSWLFFGLHLTGFALLDVLAMWLTTFMLLVYHPPGAVRWLMMPYLFWISYASALNLAIFLLNSA
jgi:tryptophan-rich sensory protein